MIQIDHPYQNLNSGGKWLRGNLHAHTTRSDGKRETQDVLDDYASRGYDFLMISDHDVFTSKEDYNQFDSRGMVLIPGNEVSKNGPHILHVNATHLIPAHQDRQQVLNAGNADGSFFIINHPNWHANFNHCPQELLETLAGYTGIEIYNGVIGRLPGSPYALDRWDRLLSKGRRVWGYANDDSHRGGDDMALGWNTIYTEEKTVQGVVEALKSGRFYASTGVVISRIQVDGLTIRIETANADRIVALGQHAKRIATVDASSIEFTVTEDTQYVRFECWGRGESFAWTQPFFIQKT